MNQLLNRPKTAEMTTKPKIRRGSNGARFLSRASHPGAGFTLIELLIVIALTGLLLGLMFGPIIQGFKLTNKARALTQAQDATRFRNRNASTANCQPGRLCV